MGIFEIGGVSLLVAFVAGVLSCASPCVLPLIPAYLGYLTGASFEGAAAGPGQQPVGAAVASALGATGASVSAGVATRAAATPSPFRHALSFVAGFSLVFVAFGVSLGLVGFFLRDHQDVILKVAGGLLIVMGLHLSGVITIPFLEQ